MFTKIYEKIKEFFLENYKFLIILCCIICLFYYQLPYVIYKPGGIVPLDNRIKIENEYDSDGTINMSYVSLVKASLPFVLFSYIMPNWDLVSKSEITQDNQSVDELLKLEKLYMSSSIDNATIVAYKKAEKNINVTKNINNIVYISDDAKTNIKIYDKLISVDGKDIKNINELKEIINSKKENDRVNIIVNRDGKEKQCFANIYKDEEDLKIGIAFLTTYEYNANPNIKVKTKSSESGSSGGLMLSLAIYNSLIEKDITKGKTVVGTGTIDISGNVGAIDGVKYKILGAVKNNADIFICPLDNLNEALNVKKDFNLDLDIYGVSTFDEALNVLNDM